MTHVIAEAGNNHNGDAATAHRLVDVAAEAGADSVKFQIIFPEGLYLPEFPREHGAYEPNPVIEARKRFMLADDEYRALAAHAADAGIGFSASVFDQRGLDLLDALDPAYLKIASTDLNNVPFVRAVAERGRKVVLSTGMSTLEEVKRSVDAAVGTGNEDLVLLHCVSVYPATLDQMRLWFLDDLRTLGLPIGLSDHTPDPAAAAMAIAKGATWLEKHFTLDKTQEGFDHAYALEPRELEALVHTVRSADTATAGDDPKVGPAEREVMKRARRALYAAADLPAGTELTYAHLAIVRPEGPLAAADADAVVGRRLAQPLRRYEAVTWEALEA